MISQITSCLYKHHGCQRCPPPQPLYAGVTVVKPRFLLKIIVTSTKLKYVAHDRTR